MSIGFSNSLINSYNRLITLISGEKENLPLEKRIYNIAAFVSVLIALLSTLGNIVLKLHYSVTIITGVSGIIVSILYYQSRFRSVFHTWLFILVTLFILSASWVANEGSNGSINFVYIVASVIYLSITRRNQHVQILLVVALNIILLYQLEKYFPQFILSYPSPETRHTDMIFAFSYVLFFSTLMYSYLKKSFDNERDKTVKQRKEMEYKHQEITDSIKYASKIQTALLPSYNALKDYFEDSFVFWIPKHIVSGDFYWVKEVDGKILIAAVDCTGHGVPGAFMSILGISLLNEIVLHNKITQPNIILNELRNEVKRSLQQTEQRTSARDGMDMSICAIDKKNQKLEYAGAFNPLIIVRNDVVIQYKANRMPVGIYIMEEENFTNHEISLEPGDNLYMFSDGFPDQIGGKNAKKFKMNRFKELLLEIYTKPMSEQHNLIKERFNDWIKGHDQTDDILFIGFRID